MSILILFLSTFVATALINVLILWIAWNFVMPSVFALPESYFISAIVLRFVFVSLFGKSDYFSASHSGQKGNNRIGCGRSGFISRKDLFRG